MATVDSLVFDISMNTQPFEQGAQNMSAALQELLNGTLSQLSPAVENVAQGMTAVTGAGAEMGAAIDEGGQAAAGAFRQASNATQEFVQQTQASAANVSALWQNTAAKIQSTMTAALRSFVAPLTAVFGVTSVFRQYTAQADRLGKMVKSMDLDLAKVQAWSEAATRAGGSAEAFQNSLQALNRQVQMLDMKGGAKGGGLPGAARLKMVLDTLGISAKDASGKVKDVFTLLPELAGTAEKMGNAKFAGIAQRLGLDQGTVKLLQMGRAEVEKLVERQRRLGGYTEQDAKVTADFNDAIADLTQVFKVFAAAIMRVVTPVLTATAQAFTWLIDKANSFKTVLQGLAVVLIGQIAGRIVPKLITSAMTLAKVIKTQVITTASTIRLSLAGLKIALKSVFTGLVMPLIIEDLLYFFMGKKSLTGYAVDKLKGHIEKIKQWAADFAGWGKQLWNDTIAWFSDKWNAFVQTVTGWMPEPLKEHLGLAETTPEKQQARAEAAEFNRLQTLENPGGIAEDVSVAQDRWERAKKAVADNEKAAAPAAEPLETAGKTLAVMASQSGESAVAGAVTNNVSNNNVDAVQNVTVNVNTDNPQDVADKVPGLMKTRLEKGAAGLVTPFDVGSGMYNGWES